MTVYQDTGISIAIYSSLFSGLDPVGNYTDQVVGYSHQIDADGGYRLATLSLACDQPETEDWFANGLMRHIIVQNDAREVVWAGFVNQVSVTLGGLTITRGPVLEISNRVLVAYSRLDTSVTPPINRGNMETAYAESSDSQALYGVLETRVSGGSSTDAGALQLRDAYLMENRYPQVTQQLDLSGAAAPTVTLSCSGYVEYLDHFVYEVSSTASQTISAKIIAVLAARPNGVISADTSGIMTNALITPTSDQRGQTGWAVLKGLVAMGDASYNRTTLGMYAGLRMVYTTIPTVFDYEMRLSENEVRRYGGAEANPWDIKPARWLFYADYLPGLGAVSEMRIDPRAQFIESVTYTAPWGLTLMGGKIGKLSQKIAQMGIAGI